MFSRGQKNRKCRLGVLGKSCQSLELSGENTVEISETSNFFSLKISLHLKIKLFCE